MILFNLVSGDNCCNRVEATYERGSKNGAYDGQSDRFTSYTKQRGDINDKPQYLSDNGEEAIWYQGGKWRVGSIESKGSSWAGMTTKSTDDCPNEPAFNWRYFDDDEWHDADQGFSIWCEED